MTRPRLGRIAMLAGAFGLALLGPVASAPTTQAVAAFQTMRAADFLDTLGVNLHIGSDSYNDVPGLAGMLRFLGIRNVRQSSPIDAAGLAKMQLLGQSGAKFALIVNGGGPVDLDGAMKTVLDMAPYLNAVEGVNEAVIYPIGYKGITGIDAAVALQKDLHAAVRASPALANAATYIFTIGGADPGQFPVIGDMSAHADFANVHSYPPHGLPPIFVLHAAIAGGRTSAASRPVVVTETGYYTLPDNDAWGGVPESVQANFLTGLLLDQAAAGTARTYLYDLVDDGPDPEQSNREHHFGLFRLDGTPKPAATAIHTMTTLLNRSCPGTRPARPAPLAGSALGVPYNHTGNTLALIRGDGVPVLILWNQQQNWDPATRTARPVRHFPTTVTLPTRPAVVLQYDPLVGAEPVAIHRDAAEIVVDLTDHPIMLVLGPACAEDR